MEKDLRKILRIITNAPDNFIDQLSKTEQVVYQKVLEIIKELDIDLSGNIKSSTANLKKLNEIRTQLGKSLLSKEYLASVKEFVSQFQTIAKLQNKTFDTGKAISKTITNVAIDNTLETLTGKGYTNTVIKRLRDVIQTSVTSGGSYKDLSVNLENLITGDGERQSIIKRQIQTSVSDALSIFSAEHTKLITAGLNFEWFTYVGSNIETTREFCEHLTKKEFVHTSEIPQIIGGYINGHQCKLGRNGLPLGMFDDTNAQNFQVNRGGYNCRHQLYPISKEKVPLHLRIKHEDTDIGLMVKKEAALLDDISKSIAKKTGASVTDVNIKSRKRILEKAASDYNGDISHVKDIVRNTFLADEDKQKQIISVISRYLTIDRIKHQEAANDPLGYSGVIINVQLKNGLFAEIQVNSPAILYGKDLSSKSLLGDGLFDKIKKESGLEPGLGHKYYEEWRKLDKIKDSERRSELEKLSKEYYEKLRRMRF